MLQQEKSISKKAKSKACTGNQYKLQTQQTKPRAIQIAICLQVRRLSKFTSDPDGGLGRRFATKSHSCSFRTRNNCSSCFAVLHCVTGSQVTRDLRPVPDPNQCEEELARRLSRLRARPADRTAQAAQPAPKTCRQTVCQLSSH